MPSSPAPPARSLGPKPRILTRDHVSLALEWLAFLQAEEQRLDAELAELVRAIKQRLEARKVVEVDGTEVTLSGYARQLEDAVRKFVASKPALVFGGEAGKTARFTHGEIAARTGPQRIDFAEGESAKSIAERLKTKTGWIERIAEFLKKLPVIGKRHLGQYCDVELKLAAKTRLLDQFKRGELTLDDLQTVGLALAGGEETYSLRAYAYTATPEPDRAAA